MGKRFVFECITSLGELTPLQALCIFTFAGNVYGIKVLPAIQLMGGLCHVIFFFALIIPLILLAPRSSPDFVFATFVNESGWSSDGISWCVGLLTVTYCFMGKAVSRNPQPHVLTLCRFRRRDSHE
jgi:hypothetical protein